MPSTLLRFGALADVSYVIADPRSKTSIPGARLPWITADDYVAVHKDY